jgi:hypothetical protein
VPSVINKLFPVTFVCDHGIAALLHDTSLVDRIK